MPSEGASLESISQFTLTASKTVWWYNVTLDTPDGHSINLENATATTYTHVLALGDSGTYTVHALMSDGVNTSVQATLHFALELAPRLVSSSPEEGAKSAGTNAITLTANGDVAWTNIAVRKPDGSSAALTNDSGMTYARPFDASATGEYIVTGTISAKSISVPFTVHFLVAGAPKLVTSDPLDGSTVQQASQIVLTADQPVSWTKLSVVKIDGTTTTLGD